jgi:SagB-type dehydrogenase family enzyme
MNRPSTDSTIRFSDVIYGPAGPPLDDPAETYHEASKNHRGWPDHGVEGLHLLETNPQVRMSASRPGHRHSQRPRISLPRPKLPLTSVADAMAARRSAREYVPAASLTLDHVSSLLYASYGVRGDGSGGRVTPSGGALYPLNVYAVARSVEQLDAGLFYYDPTRHELEVVSTSSDPITRLADAFVAPELATEANLVLVVTATFWRSRFKYGLRAYRFCLLEAGHLMQNALLYCAATGLGAVPLGGFVDNAVERVIGCDGVNESVVYVAAIGAVN